jgi:malonyl-CoA/methylmalonyl-CoA synthetase
MTGNLYALLSGRFPADRGRPALELPDGTAFSYGDLEAESARIARTLSESGAKPGDRVMVQVEKSPRAVFLYLACLRGGFVYLPLNSGYRAAEVEYFVRDAEPSIVVSDPASPLAGLPALAEVDATWFSLDAAGGGSLAEAAQGRPAGWTDVAREADDLAAILYTSGTTGRPKGAMITHRNLGSNALTLHEAWRFVPGDRLLHALPIFHTHGLFVAINTTLLNGSAMIFLPRFEAEAVLDLLPRATVFMGVPTYYVRLLASPRLTEELCRGMRLFVSGSAPLSRETFESFRQRTGHTILERYGMTEANMITSNLYEGPRVAGAVGRGLPGVEVRVVGPDGAALPAGTVGEVEVRGPNIFKGYWRNPEKTAAEFRADGFFKTGDVGSLDAIGYLTISGRSKDLIISGGLNVYPKEVEDVIDACEGVGESAVIGVPHPDFGEAVVAVATRRPGAPAPSQAAIVARAHQELAGFKCPKAVMLVDALPRNAMGKVEKSKLREQYRNLFAT